MPTHNMTSVHKILPYLINIYFLSRTHQEIVFLQGHLYLLNTADYFRHNLKIRKSNNLLNRRPSL